MPTAANSRRRLLVLLGLLLVAFVPRAVMAWKLSGICPDAVLYIRLGKALEQGQMHEALTKVQFNVFPVVLMLLHRCGLSWEAGGAMWNVLMASCAVLPLHGWLRRQFDERVAGVAGLLYALHAGLIRWSPEVLRDPTFWFLFTLSLYFMWRAAAENRWRWFAAAGLAVSLACTARIEGLVLLVPLAMWSWQVSVESGKYFSNKNSDVSAGDARHPLAGHGVPWPGTPQRAFPTAEPWNGCSTRLKALLCVGMYPLLLLVIGVFWFRAASPLALLRCEPWLLAQQWWQTGDPVTALPMGKMLECFATGLLKGLTPLGAVAIVAAAIGGTRFWRERERDRRPLVVMSLVVMAAVWIHLYWSHEASQRYFFPITILLLPFAAMGVMRISQLKEKHWRFAPLLVIAAVNLSAVVASDCRHRAATVDVGRWAAAERGPSPLLLGPDGVTQVVNYYAKGRCESLPDSAAEPDVLARVAALRPDVVLLDADRRPAGLSAAVAARIESLGFRQIDRRQFRDGCRLLVLVRTTRLAANLRPGVG